jgi:hypothetical protein
MENNIKYWAKLIKESSNFEDIDYDKIADEIGKLGYSC